jgi:VanZ family protein
MHRREGRATVKALSVVNAWLRRWWLSLLLMAIIFAVSSTPGNDLPQFGMFDLPLKKGGHILGYALLAASYLHNLANSRSINIRMLVTSIILAGFYGLTDEFHQSFTPGRTPSITDVSIDTIGAALGAGTWALVKSVLLA